MKTTVARVLDLNDEKTDSFLLTSARSRPHVVGSLIKDPCDSLCRFFVILGSFALTFGDQELKRTSGTELLEMLVSVIGTNGFFILALLIGIGSGKPSLMIASFGAWALYYWSYVRIFPKDIRRSILLKR